MNLNDKNQRIVELFLVLITVAITCVLYQSVGHKMIVLNLYYLPVVLAGFFLGRYRAGVLALLSVVGATIVIVANMQGISPMTSPVIVGLSVTVWGSVLGLTALLVGTLCDDRTAKALEAREAHVGVVEVLARYLQNANPKLQSRAMRISGLSEAVAKRMRLSEREIDDIRVAALLMDMENLEITARVIKKAVGELEDYDNAPHTFHGTELVESLGSVLTGAFPLLLTQAETPAQLLGDKIPFGARIIRTVRAYDHLTQNVYGDSTPAVKDVIEELESDIDAEFHPAVLHALEEVIEAKGTSLEKPRHAPTDEPELVGV